MLPDESEKWVEVPVGDLPIFPTDVEELAVEDNHSFDQEVDAIMLESLGGEDSEFEAPAEIIRWIPEENSVACHGKNPQLWDPRTLDELKEAQAICATCPLKKFERCRTVAEMNGESGVWAGGYYIFGTLRERPRLRRPRGGW